MKVLVLGAGICGLGTALLLARDGHEVTLIDRDADPVPESLQAAWEHWDRKGVAQFRQPHNFMPGLREILETDLPDLQESLAAAGAGRQIATADRRQALDAHGASAGRRVGLREGARGCAGGDDPPRRPGDGAAHGSV